MPAVPKRYTNVVLSSNPCPDCKRANGVTMTMPEWKSSPFGIPGSDKRVCDGHCHCVLVPEDMMKELPEIDKKAKLRGDKITDIGKTVDIYPNEIRLKRLMDKYNRLIGKLPPEIYEMPLNKVIDYLDDLLKKLPPTGVPGVPKKINIHENLTAIEKKAIKDWTDYKYKMMRKYLTAGDIERENLLMRMGKKNYGLLKKDCDILESLFKKYKNGLRQKVLYRGLSDIDEDVFQAIKAHKKGDILKLDNTMTSWSDEYKVAEGFTGGKRSVIFQLEKGRITTNEFDIDRYSIHKEGEVLMRNTEFKVKYVVERKSMNPQTMKWDRSLSVYLEEKP